MRLAEGDISASSDGERVKLGSLQVLMNSAEYSEIESE